MSCLAEGQDVLHVPARSVDFDRQDDQLLDRSARKKDLIKLKWRKEEALQEIYEILTCNKTTLSPSDCLETPLARTSAHATKMKEDVADTERHMSTTKTMPSNSCAWYLGDKYAKNKDKKVMEKFAVGNTLVPVTDLFASVYKQCDPLREMHEPDALDAAAVITYKRQQVRRLTVDIVWHVAAVEGSANCGADASSHIFFLELDRRNGRTMARRGSRRTGTGGKSALNRVH